MSFGMGAERGAPKRPKMTASSDFSSSAGAHLLPTGTVTFLFSDIEGSTQRWETHREAMDAAMKRHDAHLCAATQAHGGHVFKTVGDAFCMVFARVSDAIAACVDAQRALNADDFSPVEGLRIRCALHTGEAIERNGDYFGPAVNRVARLLSIGHGGQTLVSGVTRDLAHSDLRAGSALVDLGFRRLKDLAEPEHVWQLNVTGLPAEFPPLRSLDTLPNNLPIQRTSFVGRQHDVGEVKELLGRHHLLTLLGSGGVGKTRLALQVGAELLDRYPDGVWFVDFAPITDPELVSSVIAQTLGMSQHEGRRIDEAIPLWLKRKKLLLIFDNCEHVLEAVASLTDAILAADQDAHIVTTSRQALDVSGEKVLRLASLEVPHSIADLAPSVVIGFGAVALFADRASLVDKSFTLTDDTAPIVAEICRRLDGIPLAIELAAARVKVLSISNLAQRLNERFKILTGGSRSALPRQKTLSALIDWSYDLLTSQEQLLFARLGIFAGGFSLDAATSVCGSTGFDELDILDLLSSLTDKSLVVADTTGEQERYRLLESTAAYALEKLSAAGQLGALARRHAEYFRDQAEAAHERYGTGSTFAWLAEVERELDNNRTALEWALTQGNDAVVGEAIASALGHLWVRGGLTLEGRYWVGLALERVSEVEHPKVAASLRLMLARLSYGKRKRDEAERAMKLYEFVGDVRRAARAESHLAFALFLMGRLDEATAGIARALHALRECGDNWYVASCLNYQGAIASDRGDLQTGHELFAQALATFKALGDEMGTASVLLNLAESEFAEGHPEQALRLIREALVLDLRGKDAESIAIDHVNSAAYRIALGDSTGARESAREGLRFARQAQDTSHVAISLQHFALLAALGGNEPRGAQLLGYVNAQYSHLEMEREPTEQWGYTKLMAALRERLSEDEVARLGAEGAGWSEDQAVDEALQI